MPFLEIYKGAVHINSLLDNRIKEQLDPNSDVNREIGAADTIDGKEVYWSGQNYGWQSKASYEKLKEGDEFKLGHIAASRLEASAGKYIGQAIDQLPEPVKEKGAELIQGAVDTYESLPEPVQYVAEGTVSNLGKINQVVSDVTNVSPILTAEALTLGAGAAVKPVAKTAKIVTKKGAVSLAMNIPAPTAYALTATDPRFIAKGVTQGIADLPEFSGQLARMEDRITKSESRLKRWLAAEPGKVKSRNIKKSRDNLKGQGSTGPSRIENKTDEGWYNTGNQNFIDEIGQTPQLGFERHHMFPKAESYIFVDRLRSLIKQGAADKDDMVNLFLYAEDAGAVMGNRKANMLLMEKIKQHGPHHRMREVTEGAYGMVMEPDNLQDLADVVNTAKSADELMELFDEYLIKNIQPSKRDAFQRVMQKSKDTITETRMGSVLSEADRRRL